MLAKVGMGHNSAACGQLMVPVLTRKVTPPKPPKQRFPFFKFYPRDWLEATRDMTLDERGAYIDLICLIMEMEGHLADNDKWISHQMHVSTRKWQTMKTRLVVHEKIKIQDGEIVNDRCLKELEILLTQRQNIAGSALTRERTKRDSIVSQARTENENPEKTNENNEDSTTVVALRARVLDLDTDLEKKESPPTVPPGGAKRTRRKIPETYSDNFEKFWEIYPFKKAKGDASKAWEILTIEQKRKAYRALLDQSSELQARMDDPRGNFCAYPGTWIRQRRFDDEAVAPAPSGTDWKKQKENDEFVRKMAGIMGVTTAEYREMMAKEGQTF